MKKIFYLAAMLLVACTPDNGNGGTKDNGPDCVIPADVVSGEEGFIQWDGFDASSELYIRLSDGTELPLEIGALTSSGLTFIMPTAIEPGTYELVLMHGKKYDIGSIKVLEGDMPVTGLAYPAAAEPGGTFLMTGIGFDEYFSAYLKSATTTVSLSGTLTPSGLDLSVPNSAEMGEYALYLSDGSKDWLLSSRFWLSSKRALKSLSVSYPYGATDRMCDEYTLTYESGNVTGLSFRNFIEGTSEESYSYSYTLVGDTYQASFGQEDVANSLNYSFKYNYDEAGKITSALVNRYTNKYPEGLDMENLFAYNSDGTLARISYDYNGNVDLTRQEYEYEGGNLVATHNTRGYTYENSLLLANPFAFDVAMGIEAINHLSDPFIYLPYMAGWHSFRSALLPSAIILPDQDPNAASPTYSSQIRYEFDVEGYVTSLSYNQDNGNGGFEEIIVKFGY